MIVVVPTTELVTRIVSVCDGVVAEDESDQFVTPLIAAVVDAAYRRVAPLREELNIVPTPETVTLVTRSPAVGVSSKRTTDACPPIA